MAHGVGGHDDGHAESFSLAARFCEKSARLIGGLRNSTAQVARRDLWEVARESLESTPAADMLLEATVLVRTSDRWEVFSCGRNRVFLIAGSDGREVVASQTVDRGFPPDTSVPLHLRGIATRMLRLDGSADSFEHGSAELSAGTGLAVIADPSLASQLPEDFSELSDLATWVREAQTEYVKPNRRFGAVWCTGAK